jgi:hypothetical protein
MGLFNNLTSDAHEVETEDRLGGFSVLESGSYDAKIKVAYAGKAASGAQSVTFIFDINGRELRETIYITNKQGQNFYLTKDKKKAPLPGFTTVDHICLVASGAPLSEQTTEDKMVKVYDKDAGAEIPKSLPVLTDLVGKTITLGLLKVLENKTEKDSNGNYVAIAETRESNQIDKVFDTDTKMTVVEAVKELEPTFHTAWVEKNAGQTRDKREIKDGQAGGAQSGRPGRPAGGPPQQSTGASSGRKLFGNKAA